MTGKLCPCGQSLHYTDKRVEETIALLIEREGEMVTVLVDNQHEYEVSRHFIALHGLRAQDLEALSVKGIVKKISTAPDTGVPKTIRP